MATLPAVSEGGLAVETGHIAAGALVGGEVVHVAQVVVQHGPVLLLEGAHHALVAHDRSLSRRLASRSITVDLNFSSLIKGSSYGIYGWQTCKFSI